MHSWPVWRAYAGTARHGAAATRNRRASARATMAGTAVARGIDGFPIEPRLQGFTVEQTASSRDPAYPFSGRSSGRAGDTIAVLLTIRCQFPDRTANCVTDAAS